MFGTVLSQQKTTISTVSRIVTEISQNMSTFYDEFPASFRLSEVIKARISNLSPGKDLIFMAARQKTSSWV